MSSSSSIVEHVVLLRFREDAEEGRVSSCLSQLNALSSLDSVLHLTAGPLYYTTNTPPSSFTHLLHARYSSRSDLLAYANHPRHLSVVNDSLLLISGDIMAVDWINDDPAALPPGAALRLLLMKPRRFLEGEEKAQVLLRAAAAAGAGGEGKSGARLSRGENFSPARGKGYSLAAMAIFAGVKELDGVERGTVEQEMMKGGVGELLESVIAVDYLPPTTTNY